MSTGSLLGARRRGVLAAFSALVLVTIGGSFALVGQTAGASVNLSCPQGTTEYKVDGNLLNGLSNGQSTQFTVNGQTFTITKVVGPDPFGDDTFDFSSTIAVSVVYVKGGVDTNEYDYAPPATSGTMLHPPLNGGSEAPAISHASFCAGDVGTTTTTTTVPVTDSTTTTTIPDTTTSTTTTIPDTTTSTTTTTVPETTTSTTTTVPETTTSTTTTIPDTTTSTTTTVPDSTTTSTTVPDSTTTSTTVPPEATTVVKSTTTTEPTTVGPQGGPDATTTTTPPVTPLTVPGTLPRTGSSSGFPVMFGFSCLAAGGLLIARRRRAWNAS